MSEKDVWRWILNKVSSETIHIVYSTSKIKCSGFRTNTLRDIKTNRNFLVLNLLQQKNIVKMKLWFKNHSPEALKESSALNKEANELFSLAIERGAFPVLLNLLFEEREQEATQLYEMLQEKNRSLLDIPDESICVVKMKSKEKSSMVALKVKQKEQEIPRETEQKKEDIVILKNDDKKVQVLEKKIGKLQNELAKQAEMYAKKMEILNVKLAKYVETLKEKEVQYKLALEEKEKEYKLLEREREQSYEILLQEKMKVDDQYSRESLIWEEERKMLEERLELLQIEVDLFLMEQEEKEEQRTEEELQRQKETEDVDVELTTVVADEVTRILVIGKPVSTMLFQREGVEFTFVDGKDVHNYMFSRDYAAYWILSYELVSREQFLLGNNDSYAELDKDKIQICKEFRTVRTLLEQYNKDKESVL